MNGFGKQPWHVLGLVLFFVVHGYAEYAGILPPGKLLPFTAKTIVAALLMLGIFRVLLGSYRRAGLFVFLSLCFYLFFGAFQDFFLKGVAALQFMGRYRALLTGMLLLLGISFLVLKIRKPELTRLTRYLNLLFAILLVFDLIMIAGSKSTVRKIDVPNVLSTYKIPSNRARPSIYLIILDEYSGRKSLLRNLNYSNDSFLSALRTREFFVARSSNSNYCWTAFSMGSLFSAQYIPWPDTADNVISFSLASKVIDSSTVLDFIRREGYLFKNFSIFSIQGQPRMFNPHLMALELDLITAKTFPDRFVTQVDWNLFPPGFIDSQMDRIASGNEKIAARTRETARETGSQPFFVYAHLLMPHFPFLFDSLGRRQEVVGGSANRYLDYLAYTNGFVLKLVDDIKRDTKGEAVIMVLSDHGYRDLPRDCACNLNAVYLPNRDYGAFYDSITNVNQFRVLFNTLFDLRIPLLPDSVADAAHDTVIHTSPAYQTPD